MIHLQIGESVVQTGENETRCEKEVINYLVKKVTVNVMWKCLNIF